MFPSGAVYKAIAKENPVYATELLLQQCGISTYYDNRECTIICQPMSGGVCHNFDIKLAPTVRDKTQIPVSKAAQ